MIMKRNYVINTQRSRLNQKCSPQLGKEQKGGNRTQIKESNTGKQGRRERNTGLDTLEKYAI